MKEPDNYYDVDVTCKECGVDIVADARTRTGDELCLKCEDYPRYVLSLADDLERGLRHSDTIDEVIMALREGVYVK